MELTIDITEDQLTLLRELVINEAIKHNKNGDDKTRDKYIQLDELLWEVEQQFLDPWDAGDCPDNADI